jgi:hypothetical protein
MNVTIGSPNRDDFKAEFITTLMMLIIGTGGRVNLQLPQGCYLDDMRNEIWDSAKGFDSDWLVMIDSDNCIESAGNVFQRMTSLGKDIISGVYVQGSYPHRPLVYDFTGNGILNNTDIPKEPFTRDATGAGLLFISKKVMDAFTPDVEKRLGRPFNFLNYGQPNMLREDPAFCWRAKQLGFEVWFDPTMVVGHLKKHKFLLSHFEKAKEHELDDTNNGGIPGWMTEKEMEFLSSAVANMESVVEIGSWKGRSTKALLEGCKGTVTAVDHWQGSAEIKEMAKAQDVFAEFMKNVGHYPNLRVIKMPSLEAAASLNGDMFDMVFIDASHDYTNVKADIEAWFPRTKKLICGHDYSMGWPGVTRAVDEKFGNRVKTTETIWFVEVENALA